METTKELSWTAVLTMLRDQGVASINLHYAGGGDSGAIEHIGYFSEANTNRDDDGSICLEDLNAWDHQSDIEPENIEVIQKFVEDNAYPILNTFDDWWNNDGGQGVFVIDTKNGKYYAENGTNYHQTDYTSYDGKLDI